jgi:geranylgeranyl diphosphate synthase type I
MADNQGINERLGELDATPREWAGYHDRVQAELKEIINRSPPSLRSILRYHMGWEDERGYPCQGKSGKSIRSILHLLSCQAVGGDVVQVLPAAATVELVHNFSLIHDDVQDGSYERRGRPTVWRLWGKSQAINIGDLMFALASLVLLKLKENGVGSEEILYSFRLLVEACEELCEGQYLDIEYENQLDITVEDYLSMIRKKTAALIAASTSLGAYLGKGGEKVLYFHQFGEALGMAYQIRDDILGIWGMKESTGKSIEEDIRRRKKTLPVVYALRESKDKVKLERLYSQSYIEGGDIPIVVGILDQSGARDYAQNLAGQYYRRALERLEASGMGRDRQAPLKDAAHFLVERNY